jgi:predicted metal-dependent hydrolase
MTPKTGRIAGRVAAFQGRELDAHYLAYFDCFNRQHFYEAHDVLEALWLARRHGPNGDFFKGLIQLAGAFVHVQKNRPGPAGALLRLARANLEKYPARHQQLDQAAVFALITHWAARLKTATGDVAGWLSANPPQLDLDRSRRP